MGRYLAWRASGKGHQGWDYYAPRGSKIWAAGPGRVISVAYSGDNTNRNSWSAQMGFGHNVTIQFDNGFFGVYAHMNTTPLVRYNQRVDENTQLGVVGDSGNAWAVGTHCHFQTSRGGVVFNPESLFGSVSPSGTHVSPLINLTEAQVRKLQGDLKRLGYTIAVDGDYGKGTTAVVTTYQGQHNLVKDGLAGVNTLASIAAAIDKLDAQEAAAKAAAEAARKAAELAARLAKESATMIALIKDDEPNSSGYLVTTNGILPIGDRDGLAGREVFELLRRLRNAQRNGTEEVFNRLQIQVLTNVLRDVGKG